jgi:hypothetical protein
MRRNQLWNHERKTHNSRDLSAIPLHLVANSNAAFRSQEPAGRELTVGD